MSIGQYYCVFTITRHRGSLILQSLNIVIRDFEINWHICKQQWRFTLLTLFFFFHCEWTFKFGAKSFSGSFKNCLWNHVLSWWITLTRSPPGFWSDYDDSTCRWQIDLWPSGYFFHLSSSSGFLFGFWDFVVFLFFPSVLFRAHFTYSLSASISSPSSSIPHQILLQAQFFCPGFNYRFLSVKKLSFEAPATITVGSSLNVWLFWCVLLSRKKGYIYFLNGYKQEVIFVFFFFLAKFCFFSADKILFNVSKQC